MKSYTSSKPAPYVYVCTHKDTGEFYIGFRCKNVSFNRSSSIDLPKYKTSSSLVKPRFHEFDWVIVAEFFDRDAAYDFEQHLIKENANNPLLLNKFYFIKGTKRFVRPSKLSEEQKRLDYAKRCEKNDGTYFSTEAQQRIINSRKGKECAKWSDESKVRNKSSKIGRKASKETCLKKSLSMLGKNTGPKSEEHLAKLRAAGAKRRGIPLTAETKAKMSTTTKGRKRSPEAIVKMQETCRLKREAKLKMKEVM